jgi:hypothetical protein
MTTMTAAEGLRNCFFLNTNKIQMASSTESFANLGLDNSANLWLDNSSYCAQPHSIIVK